MVFNVSEEFRDFLLIEDLKNYHPQNEPFITLALSKTIKNSIQEIEGEFKECISIKSFLVPPHQKEIALIRYDDNSAPSGRDTFEDDGTYNTGEICVDEETGLYTEIIVNRRTFENVANLRYFEPTDRLVRYLQLHRKERNWINPLTEESIIKTEGKEHTQDGEKSIFLKIRKSELLDYLAARKCGLLIIRYAERELLTPTELSGLPEPCIGKQIKNVRFDWIAEKDRFKQDNFFYLSRLWDTFWIDPASQPKRSDFESHEVREQTVSFQQEDGEDKTWAETDRNDFILISFSPALFKSFLTSPGNKIVFDSISTLRLEYPDGTNLKGCINEEGQFQAFFKNVHNNLDLARQKKISGYSEPLKANISADFYRVFVEGQFPKTMPFKWTLCKSLDSSNSVWIDKFGQALLLSPKEESFKEHLAIGPVSKEFDELLDIMLEFRKLIIPEGKIDKIKTNLDYSKMASDKKAYEEMRSIGFTKLFFRANRDDGKDGESYILILLNHLRNCKGHPSDTEAVLSKYGIKEKNPRKIFFFIMAELCGFLLAFKDLTEKCFSIDISSKENFKPWEQLKMAKAYFKEIHKG